MNLNGIPATEFDQTPTREDAEDRYIRKARKLRAGLVEGGFEPEEAFSMTRDYFHNSL